ncbi:MULTISPECIES: DoxX-like family protein [unclassified Roseovarius]|uniref:DoxX-like family protein n=1 Tax=unclassified Roseovarius TaxID=2614913 RepID=UPI00273F675F|nr:MULTISPECIES: DoxX-like family protein [unclassified Roseovarius]
MIGTPGTVLILGADGFIGRHIAFGLRNQGWQVIASARRTKRLAQMGFKTLKADLTAPRAADPAFWRPHLGAVTHLVNAAGVLSASDVICEAVHVSAPEAVYQALPDGARGLLISAVGIDEAETDFAVFRRAGEEIASRHDVSILRPGLVLGDTSYGGSSLMRALAAMPLLMPAVGKGQQVFNPIHASDLTEMIAHLLHHPPPPGPHEVGGPEEITLAEMLRAVRRWLGLRKAPLFRLPLPLARLIGRIGDAMRLGPISSTAVTQLETSVLARPDTAITALPVQPRGFSDFLAARPAGTQDLWHARLYLMRPLLRLTLAALWLVSGLIGLTLPAAQFLPLIPEASASDMTLTLLARLGGLADIAIALALLRGWRPQLMAGVQGVMIALYTVAFSWLAPALWLLPLGGLLKNIPLLALIAVQAILEDER